MIVQREIGILPYIDFPMNYAYRLLSAPTYWFSCTLFCVLASTLTQAQAITGTVFRDFNADGAFASIATSDQDGGSYSLSFPTSASTGLLSEKANSATGANAGGIGTDANAAGEISFTLGQAGEASFTYDAAFETCTTPTNVSATATPNLVAAGATITLNASGSGITAGSTTYTWSGSGISATTATVTSSTVAAPATAGVYTYSVLVSNGGACTATAITSVTVIPPCATITVTPTTLPNAQANASYNQTLTASGGQAPYSFSVASGSLPSNLSLSSTGVISGIPLTSGITSVTVRATDARNCSTLTPITITVGTGPVCSLATTAFAGPCQGMTNTYTLSGNISATNGPNTQSLTISVGNMYTVVTLNGNGPVTYNLEGLPAAGGTQTFSITSSFGACGVTSQIFTAPVACAAMLDIDKQVNKAKARLADLLTYTVRVANNSPIAASNVVVQDVMSDGLVHAPNSLTVTAGTFTTSTTGVTWNIPSVPGNTTVTLTYLVSVVLDGVQYNTARIPGDEAKVCTTVPIQICRGNPIAIQLDAPIGYTRYQWYLTTPSGTTLVSDITSNSTNAATANSYTATLPGEYQVVVDESVAGSCPDLSCCPVIIEEVDIPPFTAQIRNPTCLATTPQANGQVTLVGLGPNPSVYSYKVSAGNRFNDNAVRVGGIVPVSGLVATTLPAGTYTIRITFTEGPLLCFRDLTITLTSDCGCKPDLCMPVMIVNTKSVVKRR